MSNNAENWERLFDDRLPEGEPPGTVYKFPPVPVNVRENGGTLGRLQIIDSIIDVMADLEETSQSVSKAFGEQELTSRGLKTLKEDLDGVLAQLRLRCALPKSEGGLEIFPTKSNADTRGAYFGEYCVKLRNNPDPSDPDATRYVALYAEDRKLGNALVSKQIAYQSLSSQLGVLRTRLGMLQRLLDNEIAGMSLKSTENTIKAQELALESAKLHFQPPSAKLAFPWQRGGK